MAVTASGKEVRKQAGGSSIVGMILIAAILSSCADREHAGRPSTGPNYKIGNPYQINGIWYYPKVDYNYSETGIASWYGADFHGKPTANGEIFDMNSVSAAHRTLPLPSIVRVTNLDNGRSLKMRVNDRGPFAKERIIDVSRRSAQLLGFYREGTARVKVEIVADESLQLAMQAGGAQQLAVANPEFAESAESVAEAKNNGVARNDVVAESLPVPLGDANQAMATPEGAVVPTRTVSSSQLYIQAGAYSQLDNASRVRDRLSGLGSVQIHPFQVDGRSLYRVRLGPLSSSEDADRLLARTVRAGYPGSHIVFE